MAKKTKKDALRLVSDLIEQLEQAKTELEQDNLSEDSRDLIESIYMDLCGVSYTEFDF